MSEHDKPTAADILEAGITDSPDMTVTVAYEPGDFTFQQLAAGTAPSTWTTIELPVNEDGPTITDIEFSEDGSSITYTVECRGQTQIDAMRRLIEGGEA